MQERMHQEGRSGRNNIRIYFIAEESEELAVHDKLCVTFLEISNVKQCISQHPSLLSK